MQNPSILEAEHDKLSLLNLHHPPTPTASSVINVSTPKGTPQTYFDVSLSPSFGASIDSTFSETVAPSAEQRDGHPLRIPSLSPAAPLTWRGSWRDSLRNFWIRNKGLALVLFAQFFGALMNVATRILETVGAHGEGMHPFQILFARMSITAVASCIYMWYAKTPDAPLGAKSVRWLLIIRGLGGFFGVFGLYYSLLYIPLSEATVLTFLAPIATCYVLSFVIPDEPFTRHQQVAGVVSLLGVLLIARPAAIFKSITGTGGEREDAPPVSGDYGGGVVSTNTTSNSPFDSHPLDPTSSQHLLAIGVSLLGVLGACVAYTTIRMIGKRAHPLISVNYFATWCTFVSIVAIALIPGVSFRLPGNLTEWTLLFFLGSCGFVMQFLLTAGLAYDSSSANCQPHEQLEQEPGRRRKPNMDTDSGGGARATSMVYTQMLFALFFDKTVWGITPGWASWAGSGLILASAVWVAVVRDREKSNRGQVGLEENRGRKMRDAEEGRGLMQRDEEEEAFVVGEELGESSNSPRGDSIQMTPITISEEGGHISGIEER